MSNSKFFKSRQKLKLMEDDFANSKIFIFSNLGFIIN